MLPQNDISNDDEFLYARTLRPQYDILSLRRDYTLHWIDALAPIPVRSLITYPILLEQDVLNCDLICESSCHLFHMNDERDSFLYNLIKDRTYMGWYLIAKEETKWDENNNVLIWLEWVQRYYENNTPKEE